VTVRRRATATLVALTAQILAVLACAGVVAAAEYGGFSNPQPVLLRGYSADAMEPFITPDGQYLLFNTSNVAPSIPSLQLASRVDADTFVYEGPLQGEAVNEPGRLSGTPSMDGSGTVYFVSNRSYEQTLATVYAGQFAAGSMTGVHLVAGVTSAPGFVDFDACVSPDGSSLYVSVGDFRGGGGPSSATLELFDRNASGFATDRSTGTILKAVNKAGYLDYAAAVSVDGLELLFTRAKLPSGVPGVYRAYRSKLGRPFGHVQRVAAITGFSEAPSLSADGSTLYFHHRSSDGTFQIETVTRP
jgi:hypothetical protein